MLFWLNVFDMIKDVGVGFINVLKRILFALGSFFLSLFKMIRQLFYLLLCFAFRIGLVMFLFGLYYAYKCYVELRNGIAFLDMKYLNITMFLLLVPIGIAVLKEFINPNRRQY